MNEHLKNIFYKCLTWCFFGLWVLVAIISMYHTGLFFAVGNPMWLACIMSVAFEVGLALTLFSILTTDNHKSTVPWVLMVLLTAVQICGNVYSVFKYMIVNKTATDAYTYINGSFLHWFVEDMPKTDVLSIISIMLGAILPIVALFMTDMVANNFKLRMDIDNKKKDDIDTEAVLSVPNPIHAENKEVADADILKTNRMPIKENEIPRGKVMPVKVVPVSSKEKTEPVKKDELHEPQDVSSVLSKSVDSSIMQKEIHSVTPVGDASRSDNIVDVLKKDKNIHILDDSSQNIIDIKPELKTPDMKNTTANSKIGPFVTIRPK